MQIFLKSSESDPLRTSWFPFDLLDQVLLTIFYVRVLVNFDSTRPDAQTAEIATALVNPKNPNPLVDFLSQDCPSHM